MKRKGLMWQIRSDHVADHIFLNFFGNKLINDLQRSYEGYAQELALKKKGKTNYKCHNAMQFVYYR